MICVAHPRLGSGLVDSKDNRETRALLLASKVASMPVYSEVSD